MKTNATSGSRKPKRSQPRKPKAKASAKPIARAKKRQPTASAKKATAVAKSRRRSATATPAKRPTGRRGAAPESAAGGATVAGISDAAVRAATGRTWSQWRALLDRDGAPTLAHKDIALRLHERHGVGLWWSQMVTVGYEQLIGRRAPGQRASGDYQASKSRVFATRVERLFDAWNDDRQRRRWLDDPECQVTTSTRPKSVRIAWSDGRTRVDVNLYAKGAARSMISLQHEKLSTADEVAEKRAYWHKQFEQLARHVEAV